MSTCCAVIVAAGRGARMGAIGIGHAKTLMPVGDAPVVGHQLRMLRDLGIRDVHIVVGHRAADIVRALGDGAGYGVRIRYVEQTAQLGIAHAVGRVRTEVRDPFLLLLGDYFFRAEAPQRMLERLATGASAIAVKRERDRTLVAAACEVRADAMGRVSDVIEKPHSPVGDLKGCGFYALQPAIFDCIAVTPRTALRDEYELTHSLDLLVRGGHHLYAEEAGMWDWNLTVPADILDCNMEWLRHVARREYVSADAVLEPGAVIDRVVVGPGARVARGAKLEESVVMPGATVGPGAVLRRALVTVEATYGPL